MFDKCHGMVLFLLETQPDSIGLNFLFAQVNFL